MTDILVTTLRKKDSVYAAVMQNQKTQNILFFNIAKYC